MRDAFHDAFAAALAGDDGALGPWWTDAERGAAGLAVYRNTVARGCIEALAGLYPTVAGAVGEDWFAAAAGRFAREQPPTRPALLDYGEGFADWLTGFRPAAGLPYLPDLARLDRMWTEAHLAADAVPLDAAAFAALGAEDYAQVRAVPHPSARTAWFDTGAASLWRRLRDPARDDGELELGDAPEGVLVLRPALEVESLILGPAGLALLAACRNGQALGEAAAAALAAEPDADLAAVFAALIAAGAFARLERLE